MENQYQKHFIGIIMSKSVINWSQIQKVVEMVDSSIQNSCHIVLILQNIFNHEKSCKIIVGVQILQHLIKNCKRGFHQSANTEQFQNSILGLLKQIRGKKSFIKGFTSNKQNWTKIQNKVLYLIQLWYDIFILEEERFQHIIRNYKLLRGQGITFPSINPLDMLSIKVQTQSPIVCNIKMSEIVKKNSQGVGCKKIDLQQFSNKLEMLENYQNNPQDLVQIVQRLKQDIRIGQAQQDEFQDWVNLKKIGEQSIIQWEMNNLKNKKKQNDKSRKFLHNNKKSKTQISELQQTNLQLFNSWKK